MSGIGELEAEVLGIVRSKRRVSAREVFRVIYKKRDIAYTTISTTLERLTKKHLLTREVEKIRGNPTYFYIPSEEDTHVRIASRSIARLVKAFGPGVVSAAYSNLPISKEELKELEGRVKEAKSRANS